MTDHLANITRDPIAFCLVISFLVILVAPVALAIVSRRVRAKVAPGNTKLPEVITAWATFFGVFAAGITLYFLYEQGSDTTEGQSAQAYSNVYQAQLGLDQIEEQNYKYTAYFERNEQLKPGDPDADKIRMIAEHKLDVIDYFFSQRRTFKLRDDEYHAWLHYFKTSFAQSQVLCDVLRERRLVYGHSIAAVAFYSGCKHFPAPDPDVSLSFDD